MNNKLNYEKKIAEEIGNALSYLGLKKEPKEILDTLTCPPSLEFGDYSFPCFSLAKELKENPIKISEKILKIVQKNPAKSGIIKKIEIKGAYLNFYINRKDYVEEILENILEEGLEYGKEPKKNNRIVIEFPAPNTNKPLHLGHVRNMTIGESMSRILEYTGNTIIRVNMNNDRGVHICKSMLAYEKWGKNKSPDKKSDHFVGDFYVLFNEKFKQDPSLDDAVKEMLKKWEAGDPKTRALWKKMNKWALEGFRETYKIYGITHDKEYFESDYYMKGKELVEEGLKKGIFQKRKDGAVIIDLKDKGLDEKVVLRADGTSVYITQDLYLAKLKDKDFNVNGSIYVVGNEQKYHFQVLFEIFKKMGLSFADSSHHLAYGMVELPEGKMKSREGTVVDADDLLLELKNLVKEQMIEHGNKLTEEELEEKSLKIALGSIKYSLLKTDIFGNMIFDPKKSIEFEGNTGTYLQYSYARANSILRKAPNIEAKLNILEDPNIKEVGLVKKLESFQKVVGKSAKTLNPSILAHYSYDLARLFNEYYHAYKIIGSDQESFRLNLIKAFKIVFKNSINLLGIDELNTM